MDTHKIDMVNQPPHYTQGGYECGDVMDAVFGHDDYLSFCMLNAFKYLWRSEHKNGIEDVKKAIWYLNKYVEVMEKRDKEREDSLENDTSWISKETTFGVDKLNEGEPVNLDDHKIAA